MEEDIGHREMYSNHTTPSVSPTKAAPGCPGLPAYSVLVPLALLTLMGCAAAVVLYIRSKSRLDELRHRLIPLYTYDPAEEEEWRDADVGDEEEELAEPLYKEGTLSFSSGYGT
ncbi:uncharacterized protein C3orf18-like [Platichthys flesus]|uniref:uncharacterized protein C3orf18-like n=1 Tax=Platichthys flesus TaxID=8260 RepID=UPI002DBDB524|nr:uncharacterized protein C3orf18-like [Platichthys flesus]